MPHVVLEGPVDLRAYARDFRPVLLRRGRDVLHADRIFVEREGYSLLLEARLGVTNLVLPSGGSTVGTIREGRHEDRE
ncbi:MAG: hypothetical protein O7B29_05550 [Deltaproteobacteria bacterium]|nr:hypothetical protein [Deltaproteobacteria bacterium]